MAVRQATRDGAVNAIIGWAAVGVIVLVAAANFLTDDLLRGAFALLVAVVAGLPALAERDWTAMVTWPLLSLVALAEVARAAGFYPESVGYLVLATLAIIIVIELERFTAVELSRWFAIGFGVLVALALEALWIIAQFYSDVWLGTEFLTTQAALQRDIVIVTAVAFVVGGIFLWFLEGTETEDTVRRSANDAQGR